jgi:hypothetical protein
VVVNIGAMNFHRPQRNLVNGMKILIATLLLALTSCSAEREAASGKNSGIKKYRIKYEVDLKSVAKNNNFYTRIKNNSNNSVVFQSTQRKCFYNPICLLFINQLNGTSKTSSMKMNEPGSTIKLTKFQNYPPGENLDFELYIIPDECLSKKCESVPYPTYTVSKIAKNRIGVSPAMGDNAGEKTDILVKYFVEKDISPLTRKEVTLVYTKKLVGIGNF